MKKLFLMGLVVLLLAMVLAGCVGPRDGLYGKWLDEQSGGIIEFTREGNLNVSLEGNAITLKYEFIDDQNIRLLADAVNNTAATDMGFKVDKDALTLSANGQESLFKRAR
jgi:hypothetical protein